jgi:hypothetical protein
MALGHSPSIVTNGLVSYWDAANTNRSARGYKNLLDLSDWTLGTGGTTTFSYNGSVSENQRILDTGPFGVTTLVWDSPSNDATSDADGGFSSPYVSIDSSQLYRFSVWLRRKNIGDGSYYMGLYGINAGLGNDGVLLRANTASVSTNPYFSAGGWPASIANNEWMLVVGHVFPANSGTGSVHTDSGLWNTSGTKFQGSPNQGDWVWKPTNTKTIHRAYLFYSTITTTNQQFYQPRIDLCDGSQPTIADLIAGVGSEWYDMIGSNHGSVLNSVDPHNSAGYMTFDGNLGANSCVVTTNTVSFGNNATWEAWVNCSQNLNTFNMFMGRFLPYFSFYNGNSLFFSIAIGGTQKTLSSGGLTTNTWYHTAFTTSYDGVNTTMKIYINGNETGSVSYAGSVTDYPYKFMIGDGNSGNNGTAPWYPFKGSVSNVKIYNRTLSASEIEQNFIALRGRYNI